MIWGRISDIYFSVITLVVTLILDKGMRSTSGEQYVVGSVRLNGQNGIPGVPSLKVPWNPDVELFIDGVYYLCIVLLILVFILLRLLLVTHFGRVLVSIRENPRRTELLGYDIRKYRLAAFVLSGAVAGLAGALYGVWGNFVAPEMFNLNQAAQVVIWVIVGGRSTLVGPIVGTSVVQYLTTLLGTAAVGQVNLVLGLILMVVVLLLQQGIVPSFGSLFGYTLSLLRRSHGPIR
jgi:branched-chain amino acid transport system permease protein